MMKERVCPGSVWPRLMALAWALMLLPVPGSAADWGIDQLMHGLAQIHSGHARFVEKKFISMLDEPIESSGELLYIAPDHLEQRTLKPKPESMTVDGDTLVIARGGRERRVQLEDYPELAAFIDSIRGTLAGDRKALERNYHLSLEGSADQWTLQLVPAHERMQAVVRRIRITGVRYSVRSIEITRTDGDHSLMRIEEVPTP